MLALLLVVSWLFLPKFRTSDSGSHAAVAENTAIEEGTRPTSDPAFHSGRQDALTKAPSAQKIDESVLRVMTWSEQPVAGATVTALASGQRIGSTDPKGELRLIENELGSGELAVMAGGFVSTEIRIPLPVPRRTDVHLDVGGQISGLVLDPRGQPVGSGLIVMAVSPLYYFDDRALGLTLAGEPLIPLVRTDESGAFVLQGLDSALQYQIFCAGSGHASFDEQEAILPAPDAYVEVQLTAVYGVDLLLRDQAGRPPKIAPMEGRWQGSHAPVVGGATYLFTTRWTEELLGLDAECNEGAQFYDKSIFYAVREDQGDSIELRYSVELPGYAPINALVSAGRALGCLRQVELVIEQICTGFGQVTVALDPPSRVESLLASLPAGRQCKLRLRENASGRVLDVRLDSLAPAGFQVISGVPYGDYSATLVGPHQLFSYPGNFGSPPS